MAARLLGGDALAIESHWRWLYERCAPFGHPGWPGFGSPGKPGKLEDAWASLNASGDLAAELVAEGYKVVKLWPFDAADYCMVDPTWSGGISESRRVIDVAQTFNMPATIHDCSGPLTPGKYDYRRSG